MTGTGDMEVKSIKIKAKRIEWTFYINNKAQSLHQRWRDEWIIQPIVTLVQIMPFILLLELN